MKLWRPLAFPMLLLKYCTLCGETFQWRWSLEVQVVVVTFVVTLSSGVKVHNVLRISNATAQNTALYAVKLFSGDEVWRFRLKIHKVLL